MNETEAWTNDGPKRDDVPHSITSSQANADPYFLLKGRVIDMARLNQIKKNLPKGIDLRIAADKSLSFRARFRRKGQPVLTQSFSDPKVAEKWLNEQKRNAEIGLHLPQHKTKRKTFREAVDHYIERIIPLRPKSGHVTKMHLLFWAKEFGDYALHAITPEMVAKVRDRMLSEITNRHKQRASATVKRYLAALSRLFSIAVKEWQWIHDNPVSKIQKPAEAKARTRFLSQEEISKLLISCKQSKCRHLYPFVVLALSTGMRRGEILGLRWQNIDYEHNQIILDTTKNGDPRCPPLSSFAKEVLQEHYKGEPLNNLIFVSTTNPKTSIDLKRSWGYALERAGLQDQGIVIHSLRHTTASHLALHGKSLHDIASLLGHKDLQVTRRYAHLTNPYKAKMVEDLSESMFKETHG